MIKENLENLMRSLPKENPFGEPITLVGATKTQSVDAINQAISAGLNDIGENKPQEFRDKFPFVLPCRYHFFGRLQKNKVKYLIGKAFLIQSVDSVELAEEISRLSLAKKITTEILLEVNLGEAQKGGIPFGDVLNTYKTLKLLPSVKICGLMAILPDTKDEKTLSDKCRQMRELYDIIKKDDASFRYLSMGMSGDYLTAIKCGSNMIRIGSKIFGERHYT